MAQVISALEEVIFEDSPAKLGGESSPPKFGGTG